jgi:hypothetical protein
MAIRRFALSAFDFDIPPLTRPIVFASFRQFLPKGAFAVLRDSKPQTGRIRERLAMIRIAEF